MTPFEGFPPKCFAFFEGLAEDNSKAYWDAHRQGWEGAVRGPMRALVAELDDEFGPLRIFRPNRDVRFSPDKSPYKLWIGATSESRGAGGTGYHVEVSAAGMLVGYGAMLFARDQLARFRAAVAAKESGTALEGVLAGLAAAALPGSAGFEPPLTRVPRGYPSDHPRAELLRWKGAVVLVQDDRAEWMGDHRALDRVREVWRGARPLRDWLDAHVGASEQPASRRP